mgnify:CR=1 FL=1
MVALGFGEENQWQLFCGILGLTELVDDVRFDTGPRRTSRHAELEPVLSAAFQTRTTREWLGDLEAAGIPCGPVNSIPEMLDDPQVKAREMIREVTHPTAGTIPIANTPLRLSRSETGIKGPPPDFAQDTGDVLAELLGLSPAEVEAHAAFLAELGAAALWNTP